MGQLEAVPAGWVRRDNALDDTLLHVIEIIELFGGVVVKGLENLLFEIIQIKVANTRQPAEVHHGP